MDQTNQNQRPITPNPPENPEVPVETPTAENQTPETPMVNPTQSNTGQSPPESSPSPASQSAATPATGDAKGQADAKHTLEQAQAGNLNTVTAGPDEMIFVSLASRLQIDNFVEEEWAGSRMTRPARALEFQEHLKVATKLRQPNGPRLTEQEFIMASTSFANNACFRVKSLDDARAAIAELRLRRSVKKTLDAYAIKETITMTDMDPTTQALIEGGDGQGAARAAEQELGNSGT